MKIQVVNVCDSMFRDRAKFPISEEKIKGLIESIEQTGFWDNVLVRVKNNLLSDGTTIVGYDHFAELVASGYDFTKEMMELAYGHHRIDAVRESGINEIDVPVRYIDDETMLRIMSNENKEGWGAGISSKLETVRQVKDRLESMLEPYMSYDEYAAAAGEEPFFSQESFASTKKDGAGAGTIQKFLGKEWKSGDVRIPTAVINAIDKKYVIQESLDKVPSLGVMEIGISMITHLYEGSTKYEMEFPVLKDDKGIVVIGDDGKPTRDTKAKKVRKSVSIDSPDWPIYFKTACVAKVIELCSDFAEVPADKDGAGRLAARPACSVAALTTKRNALVDKGAFPGRKANSTTLNVNRRVKQILFGQLYEECAEEQRAVIHAGLVKDTKIFVSENGEDGFKEWSGYAELVESITDSVNSFGEGPQETPEEQLKTVEGEEESDDRDSTEFEAAANVTELFTPNTEDGEEVAIPIGQEVINLISVMQGAEQLGIRMVDRAGEIDLEKETALKSILDTSFTNLLALYGKLYGKKATGELCSDAMKNA